MVREDFDGCHRRTEMDSPMTSSGTPKLPGDSVLVSRLVTQEAINSYAVASGDHNPLHTDPAFAATTPLGGTVAHGMLVLAWLSALLTTAYGQDWLGYGSFRIRFRVPARPGDLLELRATVRAIAASPLGSNLTLDLLVANQRGDVVIDGQAAVTTSSPPSTANASSS